MRFVRVLAGATGAVAAVEREAECAFHYLDIDQAPCRSGFSARGAELHELFLAGESSPTFGDGPIGQATVVVG